ncbi:MAG: cobalamin-binding protein [Pseudomonadota bacterium]
MRLCLIGCLSLWMACPAVAEIRLPDSYGRDLVLDSPAQRVVSLAPHITEVVFAAGAGEQLVGAVSYSDYPKEAAALPRVGSYDRVSYESIAALRPDLVLAWPSGNGDETIRRLRELGLAVFAYEPRTIEDVAQSVRQVGLLTGRSDQADLAALEFERRLAGLRGQYEGDDTVSVYYQIWNEPLLTLNGDHLISDVVRLCGGRNVFESAVPMVSHVSIESVIRADPQVVIASGMDEARPEWLDAWRDWPTMQAVREDQLYFIPPDILQRHTPRILDGAQQMCEQLQRAREHYKESAADG